MKNLYLILTFLFITVGCKKDENSIFIPKNHLQEFQSEKTQIFNLDTIKFKHIEGKYGTRFFFSREDFDISKDDKISLELIELYDFKEILYRNINTVTTSNELLETNGVLSIKFISNSSEINLKENKKLTVYPPKDRLNNNELFIAKKDSLDNLKWKRKVQTDTLFSIHRGGGIFVQTVIKKDSVPFFKKFNKETFGSETYNSILKNRIYEYFILNNNDLGWINIDRIVNVDFKINFNLIDTENQFSGFSIYFTYKNLNSFIYNPRLKDDLKFDSIPVSGKTWMTIIGEKDNTLYYDKIKLKKELNNSEIILNMKKIDKKELQKLLIN